MNRSVSTSPSPRSLDSPFGGVRGAAVIMVIATFLCSPPVSAGDESTIQLITRLEHRFAEAALKGDAAAVENLLAPGFVGVNPRGIELARDEVLTNLVSPDREINSLRHADIRVRVFDDCAVVLAVTEVSFLHNGEEVSGKYPYMRVWIKRDGSWLAVATQSMVVPESKG